MFKNNRFITAGVRDTIPVTTQMLLWMLVDTMKEATKDYLQVFRLSNAAGEQKIVHSQEEPDYKKEHIFAAEYIESAPVETKVYIIDDGDHTTMLLTEEY